MVRRPRNGEDDAAFIGMLGLPLDALIELAEEHAPGEGGEEWRRWTREAEQERHPPADASRHGIESVAKCQFCGHSRPGM